MLHKPEPLGWTEARIERLKALYNEGAPYSQIAAELGGGLTKNAIAGKVHHLKLAKREPVARKPHGNKGQPKANAIVHRVAAKRKAKNEHGGLAFKIVQARKDGLTGKGAMDAVLGHAAAPEVLDIPPELPDVTPMIGNVLGLNEHTCKWPIGNPGEPDFGFCGRPKPVDCPYCDEHAKRAYGVRA